MSGWIIKKILYLHDCTFHLNSALPSFKCWFTRLSSDKIFKNDITWITFRMDLILRTPNFEFFFFFALIWFSEWLIFTNFVGLIFRPRGSNFIVEELVLLDTFQKKSSSLLQNCCRRPYICRYRIKPTIFLDLQNIFLVQNILKRRMSHWSTWTDLLDYF